MIIVQVGTSHSVVKLEGLEGFLTGPSILLVEIPQVVFIAFMDMI